MATRLNDGAPLYSVEVRFGASPHKEVIVETFTEAMQAAAQFGDLYGHVAWVNVFVCDPDNYDGAPDAAPGHGLDRDDLWEIEETFERHASAAHAKWLAARRAA